MRRLIRSTLVGWIMLSAAVICPSPARAADVVNGQLLDANNRPVAGYPIRVDHAGSSGNLASVTDGSGNFRFFGLAPGQYVFYPLNHPNDGVQVEITTSPQQNVGVLHMK
ncbi:MAG: carboxypeptidase regulatory-like domain-containing protein [Candidatus Binataceae bacterium]|jgi:hypothetical protein